MGLDLDARQRAMLEEMHIRVWWPEAEAVAKAPEPREREVVAAVARRAAMPVTASAPLEDRQPARTSPAPSEQRQPALVTDTAGDLAALAREVADCQACGLCAGRRQAVFAPATAPRQTDWLLVGEPPDEDEERAGQPFAGRPGLLLDNMLRALQLSREGPGATGAWLTNVVKCRPGTPRNPAPEELTQCVRHLRREVALLRPKVILAMGRFAAQSLLSSGHPELAGVPFGRLRGNVYRFEGIPVVVTYPPARLLRAPEDKARAWADLCLARQQVVANQTGNEATP